jgi:hypothetical protein
MVSLFRVESSHYEEVSRRRYRSSDTHILCRIGPYVFSEHFTQRFVPVQDFAPGLSFDQRARPAFARGHRKIPGKRISALDRRQSAGGRQRRLKKKRRRIRFG